MTTEPDPAEAVPTNNSAGVPVDENRVDEITSGSTADGESDADAAERALQATPGPAGGDPVVEGLAGVTDDD